MLFWKKDNTVSKQEEPKKKGEVENILMRYSDSNPRLTGEYSVTGEDLKTDLINAAESFIKEYLVEVDINTKEKLPTELETIQNNINNLKSLGFTNSENYKKLVDQHEKLLIVQTNIGRIENRYSFIGAVLNREAETFGFCSIFISFNDFLDIINKYGYNIIPAEEYRGNLSSWNIQLMGLIKNVNTMDHVVENFVNVSNFPFHYETCPLLDFNRPPYLYVPAKFGNKIVIIKAHRDSIRNPGEIRVNNRSILDDKIFRNVLNDETDNKTDFVCKDAGYFLRYDDVIIASSDTGADPIAFQFWGGGIIICMLLGSEDIGFKITDDTRVLYNRAFNAFHQNFGENKNKGFYD
jgi:hypothetical protein